MVGAIREYRVYIADFAAFERAIPAVFGIVPAFDRVRWTHGSCQYRHLCHVTGLSVPGFVGPGYDPLGVFEHLDCVFHILIGAFTWILTPHPFHLSTLNPSLADRDSFCTSAVHGPVR